MHVNEILIRFTIWWVLFQRQVSTKGSVGGAIPRVTLQGEKTSQIKTSSPVCSYNEWDPLEVMKRRIGGKDDIDQTHISDCFQYTMGKAAGMVNLAI